MLTVEKICNYLPKLIFVDSSTNVLAIQTMLVANQISVVPIIDNGQRKNVGIVRLRKLWEWTLTHSESPSISDIKEKPLPVVGLKESLAKATKLFDDNPGVLVQGENGLIDQFLSPRIIANAFQVFASQFEPLGVLENHLQQRLKLVSTEAFQEAVGRNIQICDCTLGDYITVVSKLWDSLGLVAFDKSSVLQMLNCARVFRNELMHFRLNKDPSLEIKNIEALNRIFGIG